ncbi:Holliday junction branch migration protein RuvA [Pyruvatibacter mobilis]|uniref:Holliday junction branch migration protein RuvA n=1 Tax=Pyruvatibacter mobilis TaxID=1712261 RepID=UPI003BB077BB
MIGKLKGVVDETGLDWALIDVGGVCYLASCSGTTLRQIGGPGEAAILHIETYVREDQLRLFGFATEAEREWFRLLLSVQRVGAKAALAILTALDPQALARAIAFKDAKAIATAQGVGPKVGERIVAELKDKVPASLAVASQAGGDGAGEGASAVPEMAPNTAEADAISALVNLGYAQAQAAQAVSRAVTKAGDDAPGAEQLIRMGLKELAG